MEKGKYNPYDEDVDVIQDDENVKIVKVLTLNAAQYFGDNFYGKDHWGNHYKNGDLYFVIGKKDDTLYSIYNDDDGSVIRDLKNHDEIISVNDLKRSFLSSLKILSPLIKGGKTYEFLKKISKGYDPGWRDNGDDPIIDEIKFNERNPSNSKVVIKFEDDEVFLDTIGVEDSDDIYNYRAFTGYYSGRDYDTYNEDDRWKQGEFILDRFNDENQDKALKIAKFYENGIGPNDYRKIASILNNGFESIVDDLIFEYVSKWQDCINDVVKDIILGEIAKPFDRFGIKEIHMGYRFETTVGVLLHWYNDVENEKFTLSELLNKLMILYDKKNRGYWGELEYEVDCVDWDDNAMQEYYSKSLDSMLEKIQEGDQFANVDEYNEITDFIEEKYGFDWVKTKKDPNILFIILKIQPETNKILVNVRNNKTGKYHQRLLDIDGLHQLDNQPELFNERRIVKKKFL
jgi:hypothetical protein